MGYSKVTTRTYEYDAAGRVSKEVVTEVETQTPTHYQPVPMPVYPQPFRQQYPYITYTVSSATGKHQGPDNGVTAKV